MFDTLFHSSFVWSVLLSIALVSGSTIVFYELVSFVWNRLPKRKNKHRWFVALIMLVMFLGHTLAVWLYGVSYFLLAEYAHFGSIAGEPDPSFLSYIYFSAATYSSLGFGDVYPTGPLRMLTGVEVLNGLMLIGWSVAFTYYALERFWDMRFIKNDLRKE